MCTPNELREITTDENQPILLTAKQVAYLLGLSERSVWRLSGIGKLPVPVSIGRSKRWTREMLNSFVTRKVKSTNR